MVEKSFLTPITVQNKTQTLVEYYINTLGLREKWQEKPELKNIQFQTGSNREHFSRIQDSLLGVFHNNIIKNNLSVSKLDKKLSIITVSVTSIDENFSRYFCDILVREVSDFYVDTKTKKSVENLQILQHQVDSVKRMLNSAIGGVAYSTDANPNPNPARRSLQVPSQLRQVDVQANQAILIEMVKNLEVSKISLRRETPLVQIIDVPRFPLEKIGVGKLKSAIVGAIVFGFLTIVVLVSVRLYKQIVNE